MSLRCYLQLEPKSRETRKRKCWLIDQKVVDVVAVVDDDVDLQINILLRR